MPASHVLTAAPARGGSYTSVDFPDATSTFANGINPRGDIVGGYVDTGGVTHGFQLSGGSYSSIDFPGAMSTAALGIGPQGDVVGDYSVTRVVDCCAAGTHGYLLSGGGNFTAVDYPAAEVILTFASGINSEGSIVGAYSDGKSHGFLLTAGNYCKIDGPSATFTNTLGINTRGEIVGRYVSVTGGVSRSHGYLLSGFSCESSGQFTTIDIPGATFTGATAINSEGDIVGRYRDSKGVFHGFLLSRHEEER